MKCSASCWLLIISTVTIVIQPINPSADLRHRLVVGRGGGWGVVGVVVGGERLFLGKTAGVGKLICCFVLKLEYLIFFTAVTYLPILEGDFSV